MGSARARKMPDWVILWLRGCSYWFWDLSTQQWLIERERTGQWINWDKTDTVQAALNDQCEDLRGSSHRIWHKWNIIFVTLEWALYIHRRLSSESAMLPHHVSTVDQKRLKTRTVTLSWEYVFSQIQYDSIKILSVTTKSWTQVAHPAVPEYNLLFFAFLYP